MLLSRNESGGRVVAMKAEIKEIIQADDAAKDAVAEAQAEAARIRALKGKFLSAEDLHHLLQIWRQDLQKY